MKSEPGVYSIDDLARDETTHWDSVRNYQARNFMRDDMRPGDGVLFYHSNANPPGVAGVAEVIRSGYPDPTARDPESRYFDPRASATDPRWYMVDIRFLARCRTFVPLQRLRTTPGLEEMLVNTKSRLSVQPVTEAEFEIARRLGEEG
jgi:predicted RNA-binding protein with PUA-like domain